MQTKKEMPIFFGLILSCVILVMAAGFSKGNTENCNKQDPSIKNCCQNQPANSNISPWNFITQGILHFTT